MDIAADQGWLATSLRVMHLIQMCVQGRWLSDASILTLPHLKASHLSSFSKALRRSSLMRTCGIQGAITLPELTSLYQQDEKFVTSMILRVVESQQLTKHVSFW